MKSHLVAGFPLARPLPQWTAQDITRGRGQDTHPPTQPWAKTQTPTCGWQVRETLWAWVPPELRAMLPV